MQKTFITQAQTGGIIKSCKANVAHDSIKQYEALHPSLAVNKIIKFKTREEIGIGQ